MTFKITFKVKYFNGIHLHLFLRVMHMNACYLLAGNAAKHFYGSFRALIGLLLMTLITAQLVL